MANEKTLEKIRFLCICGRRLSVPLGTEGKKARCPVCQTVMIVPGGPDRESSIITPGSLVSGKVIVAEYDFEEVLNLTAFLSRKGFDVRSATEGLGLKMMVQEDAPDVIILSCDLPNMEEDHAWQKLREAAVSRGRPAIIIAMQGPDDTAPPIAVDETVSRPVDHHDLLCVVEQALLSRDKRREKK